MGVSNWKLWGPNVSPSEASRAVFGCIYKAIHSGRCAETRASGLEGRTDSRVCISMDDTVEEREVRALLR